MEMAESSSRFVCIYCNADVTSLRIKCAECPEDFNFCPQCFSCGAEIGKHKRSHPYCILPHDPPLFKSSSWKGSEEIMFLEKIRRFTYGNWEAAANLMESKTASELENHYVKMYLEGNIGQATHPSFKPNFEFHLKDYSQPINLSECADFDTSVLDEETCEDLEYKPKIGYFKLPYDCEADLDATELIKKLPSTSSSDKFSKEENELHNLLELAGINMYFSRLKKRTAVEHLVRDYKLVKWYSDMQASESDSSSQEKADMAWKVNMKALCRLLKPDEYNALIQYGLEEKKLKARLRELKERLGIPLPGSKKSISKPEPIKGKLNKSKENKMKKNSFAAKTSSFDATIEKETRSPNSPSTASVKKSRKRRFQNASHPESCENLLTQPEKKLCLTLSIEPACYIALKIVLLREQNIQMEAGSRNPVSNSLSVKAEAVEKVAEFMSKNGWIKAG